MADTADVVVVGGGVIGTSIAFALASAGVKRVTLLEKGALARAAAYEPASGYASPADVVEGFRRQAQARGAHILQWTPATRIVRRESAVVGVETAAARIDAGAVVVAAGAWAPRLCREIGIALDARPKALDTMLVTRPPEIAKPHMVVIDHVLGT